MPPKSTTKNWGQADRDLLADLTNRQLINITDTSHQNIEQVRDLHFRHRDKKEFPQKFLQLFGGVGPQNRVQRRATQRR